MNFNLKKISFFNRELTVICQNENGPCPLIGIANVLLLRGDVSFSPDLSVISLSNLVEQVGNQVFSFFEKSSHRLSPENMTAILNVLPNLAKGLDVNVSFNGVDKMEYTEQIALFDALNIPLLHGWIYDPFDRETAETISTLSYNHLVYLQVDYRTLVDKIKGRLQHTSEDVISASLSEKDRKLLRDGRIIERFMKQSASQLTEEGLLKLHDFLQDRQLFVFFRNNHFSTVFYHQQKLFVLVTDLGYQDQPHVIWELLESVSGRGAEFFNSDFVPLRDLPLSVLNSSPAPTIASPPPPISVGVPQMYTSTPTKATKSRPSTPVIEATENPMFSGTGIVTYDPDYETAMRLHFKENSNEYNAEPNGSATKAQGTSTSFIPVNILASQQVLAMEQYQQLQQQTQLQQQAQLQQQYIQQAQLQQQYLQQQELSILQQSTASMLKGVPVEPEYASHRPPPPPTEESEDAKDDMIPTELGMTQEELDRQTAMMLQYEEDKKAAKDRRRYEKRIRLRNRFLGLDETVGLEDSNYGNDRSNCLVM